MFAKLMQSLWGVHLTGGRGVANSTPVHWSQVHVHRLATALNTVCVGPISSVIPDLVLKEEKYLWQIVSGLCTGEGKLQTEVWGEKELVPLPTKGCIMVPKRTEGQAPSHFAPWELAACECYQHAGEFRLSLGAQGLHHSVLGVILA